MSKSACASRRGLSVRPGARHLAFVEFLGMSRPSSRMAASASGVSIFFATTPVDSPGACHRHPSCQALRRSATLFIAFSRGLCCHDDCAITRKASKGTGSWLQDAELLRAGHAAFLASISLGESFINVDLPNRWAGESVALAGCEPTLTSRRAVCAVAHVTWIRKSLWIRCLVSRNFG